MQRKKKGHNNQQPIDQTSKVEVACLFFCPCAQTMFF